MSVLLVADIGATHSRCALAHAGTLHGEPHLFRNAGYAGLAALLGHYLQSIPESRRPKTAALAVAAPVSGDGVRMINIGWEFSRRSLCAELGLHDLRVINDFEALAWALPMLTPADLLQIGGGTPARERPKVVLGPGSGLGVASLVPASGRWWAIAGEGGHVSLPAQDETEDRVINAARSRYGHCSAERVLSGPGLAFIHEVLHGAPALTPEALGERIAAGDTAATHTLEVFFRLLATVAGNAALTLGATGGVYIGGGIVPRYAGLFANSGFRARFEAKGRYRPFMQAIPTWLITARWPALHGLLAYVASAAVPAAG